MPKRKTSEDWLQMFSQISTEPHDILLPFDHQ